MNDNQGKVKKPRYLLRIATIGVSFFTLLSGALVFQILSQPLAISDLKIVIDENFRGTVADFGNEPILLSWEIQNEKLFSADSELETYTLEIKKDNKKYFSYDDQVFVHSFQLSSSPSQKRGTRQLEINNFPEHFGIRPFVELANSPAGSEVTLTLTLANASAEQKVSEATIVWVRPPVKAPTSPEIVIEWKDLYGSKPCAHFTDKAIHSFDSFPENYSSEITTSWEKGSLHGSYLRYFGGSENAEESLSFEGPYRGDFGEECVDHSLMKVRASAEIRNTAGFSNSVLDEEAPDKLGGF